MNSRAARIANKYMDAAQLSYMAGDMVAYEMYLHNARQWFKKL